MAKLTLSDLANLQNEQSAVAAINANNALIETAMENTLSRDGTSPNTMGASLDMNSNRILNLPAAASANEPVRKAEFDAATGDISDLTALVTDAQTAADAAEAAQLAAEAAQAAAEAAAAASQAGTVADNAVTNAKMADNAIGTVEIIDDAVTYAKIQNVVNNQRVLGRTSGANGVVEELSASTVLDWVDSTRGTIPSRGASGWVGIDPGTSGHVLTSNGAGADPTYQAVGGAPAGAILAFAASTAPTGWLECDGSAVSRTTYATLFSAISTTFGVGDGSTTFNLPDLRGEFVRGWANARAVDTGRVFGSTQSEMIGPHSHTATTTGSTSSSGSHSHTVSGVAGSEPGGFSGIPINSSVTSGSVGTDSQGAHTHTLTLSTTVNNNSGTENRVRNVALMYIIKT